jgi:hypothetical protein
MHACTHARGGGGCLRERFRLPRTEALLHALPRAAHQVAVLQADGAP